MKTITIETLHQTAVTDAPHEALVRLQTQVDQELSQATAQAEAEARQRAAAQKAAEAAPASRVRFAHD